jgi:hypothetical protein
MRNVPRNIAATLLAYVADSDARSIVSERPDSSCFNQRIDGFLDPVAILLLIITIDTL